MNNIHPVFDRIKYRTAYGMSMDKLMSVCPEKVATQGSKIRDSVAHQDNSQLIKTNSKIIIFA
ncbi:hypothetical protein SAMN05444280_13329 [Tangfeifania diversioriginum]|uniref:Uncharacterized protein n=1 Tax=Tangfeifania diversioriginum TaxID=1168035 RepID=A0A1M6MIV5_9BACT|nr:hypothetical protein [Tangfeifania diversioriginum]SHJ83415.1 hypothetical protein SAMN05444280_13329 [Tangfeifania diversioriginum]